ncbi:hypothetical protein L1887_31814 [Cichorium endivia]|nr:hypothetical protein L1887_31814 [Cichorium endivia]
MRLPFPPRPSIKPSPANSMPATPPPAMSTPPFHDDCEISVSHTLLTFSSYFFQSFIYRNQLCQSEQSSLRKLRGLTSSFIIGV